MRLRVNYKNSAVGYEGELTDLTSSFVYLKSNAGHSTGLSISACVPEWIQVPYYGTYVTHIFSQSDPAEHRWERIRRLAKTLVKNIKEESTSVGRFSKEPKPVLFTYDEKVST
jgi:hypothetical protein